MEDYKKREMAELLWMEINKAILGSEGVKNCLEVLKEMDMIEFLEGHDYVLDGKKLVDHLLNDKSGIEPNNDFLNEGEEESEPYISEKSFAKKLVDKINFCYN